MSITRESPWSLLHFGLLVLLALQAALIAARVLSSGADALLGAPLGVMAATLVLAASNRRLAADPHIGALTGWLVALRGLVALVLVAATGALVFDRYVSATAPDEFARGVCALLWLVLTIKGALIGKLKPNGVIGLRVPWTLESRLAWDKAHRTLGRALFWVGLAGLASSLSIPPTISMPLIIAAVVSAVTLALIEARSAWRSDPQRGLRSAR
ncbi:MAG TPA: SdpI family protein [Woeseiaceae bacterium]|nr:SdpI family protein [Woeseiaceae bacterium]